MLWEAEIEGKLRDPERDRIVAEYALLTHGQAAGILSRTTRGFLLEGDVNPETAQRLVDELLCDRLVESAQLAPLPDMRTDQPRKLTVLLKPGVMDPVAQSVVDAARDLGIALDGVRTFRRYYLAADLSDGQLKVLRKILANDAVEHLVDGPLLLDHLTVGRFYLFRRIVIPLSDADDEALLNISRKGQLALDLPEMKTIQAHYRAQRRDPTDVELETIAQTWSEHCSHKTLK
jgi:phosphoribosylformylglycinamidine synthase subunit PurSL